LERIFLSQLEEKKEIIGFLKLVFGALVAIIASFSAWLYQAIGGMSLFEKIFMLGCIIVLMLAILIITIIILKLARSLRNL